MNRKCTRNELDLVAYHASFRYLISFFGSTPVPQSGMAFGHFKIPEGVMQPQAL